MLLREKKCVPCEVGALPLDERQIKEFMQELPTSWVVEKQVRIVRVFRFKNFKEAMEFANAVAAIAESEGHHPDMTVSYGEVRIVLSTHAIKGLSENDFIVAMKIEMAYAHHNDGLAA